MTDYTGSVELSPARFIAAHAVLALPAPVRRPDLDERFIRAVQAQFPNVVNRQLLPPEVPPNTPHLTMTSTSSQLVLSAVQADFQVGFYGDYFHDAARCLDYIRTKAHAMHGGLTAIEQVPSMFGVILTLQYSFADQPVRPTDHLLQTHLRAEVNPDYVQDANSRIAVRLQDKYFFNLQVKNYEIRAFERPIMPGLPQMVTIRPWEGEVEDTGVELVIDLNNNLEAHVKRAHPRIQEGDVDTLMEALEEIVPTAASEYVAHARLPSLNRSAT